MFVALNIFRNSQIFFAGYIRGTAEGAGQELRRGAEGGAVPDGGLLRAQTQQGEQGHLPPRGLRGQVHGGLHEVHRGHLGRVLVLWINRSHASAFKQDDN